jgi:hypothetical protein
MHVLLRTDRAADGKHAAKLLRNTSLITTALMYAEETSNGIEKRSFQHLWKHLTRCMSNEFYTTNLFEIHRDELILEWMGEMQHKLSVTSGFKVTGNPLVFMRLQGFMMRHNSW